MWHYPNLDPVAISLGPISIHWYAISYLVGIGLVWWTLGYRNRHYASGYSDEEVSDLVFFAVLGVLLGGRIGYMLFYGMENLLANPASALRVWEGGMSFHGGLIGVLLGVLWFARKTGRTFFQITDFIAPSIPIALGCGRIGNFINAELPGHVTEVPWGLVYPGEVVARHPSSLYQAMLEGPVLFVLLWVFAMKPRPVMAVSGLFLVGYGLLRIFSETFRLPDSHLGFVLFDQVTQGQLLSLPMVLLGAGFIAYSYYQPKQ
ncbi:MAG: prolipoprotein diacylglyceryl transferase [Gammaproteobacteria bacterium]